MAPRVERHLEDKTEQPARVSLPRGGVSEARLPSIDHADIRALEAELKRRIRGEVRFDAGSRALYSTTGSNYRHIPIGVVIPRSVDDVIETVAACHNYGAPVLSRGGGTSLAGQCENVAVVIDMSKFLNQVLDLDPAAKLARVQPGTILDDLRNQAEKHQLTFGPDPSTHNHCTLGGMIGNNSCGVHAQMAGKTSDNVHELDILTYDGVRLRVGPTSEKELERIIREGGRRGEIYSRLKSLRDRYAQLIRARYPNIPRRISGYNLDALLPENGFNVARALVGTEGTCVTVLEATVNLVYSPPARTLVILGYPSIFEAGDHVPQVVAFDPIGLEGLDDTLVNDLSHIHKETRKYLPAGRGWLLVEFGAATKAEAEAQACAMMNALRKLPNAPTMKLFEDREEEKRIWETREGGLGATARPPGQKDTWEGWEDSAVPPERLGEYLRELQKLYDKFNYHGSLYGHFGQACVHTRIDFEFHSAEGIQTFRNFLDEATSLVVRLGGSLSGEHGDGQSRAEFLPKMFGPELISAFEEFKSIWDPQGKMNPGKIVNPRRVDQDLKLGPSYNPPEVKTHFKYVDDKGSLPYATQRCVGIGECRRMDKGTMCPSFRVTREEKDSTRGRAHLLNEMLRGDSPMGKGWKSEPVKDALDLCLSCKGCKSDCPMGVDMATYKAEFLSHYYEGKVRPIAAYAMGLIDKWAQIGSLTPRIANFFTQTPILRSIAKFVAGIAQGRQIPKFANQTFKRWFARRGPARVQRNKKVILWADTFNNHFHPETAMAAVEVLEAAGFEVIVPRQHLCCGRPLYDFGMLDLAKTYLHRVLDALRPMIRAGVPIVGLEPSCVTVFRDEMRGLLPNDLDALRMAQQTFMLSEFLAKHAEDFVIPDLKRKAVVQGHCHHQSILKMDAEKSLLKKLGIEANVLDAGCCGMAGSFGFERAKNRHEVSMQIGEYAVLPAVRAAESSALIVANGFSCREQIRQGTGRRAMHVAEVVQMALRQDRMAPEFPTGVPVPLRREPVLGSGSMSEKELFNVADEFSRSLEK